MDCSVVISTWNNPTRLALTLEALCRCALPPAVRWELVLVNNGCVQETRRIAEQFRPRLPLVYVEEPHLGISRARNAGLTAASGRLVVFTDDDVTPCREWLSVLWEAYRRRPQGYFFGGPVESAFEGSPPPLDILALAPYSVRGFDRGPAATLLGTDGNFFSPNWACPSDVLRSVGGFDVRKGFNALPGSLCIGEETDLMRRLRARGYTAWYLPAARVRHYVPAAKCTVAHIALRREDGGYDEVLHRVRACRGVRASAGFFKACVSLWVRSWLWWQSERFRGRAHAAAYIRWRGAVGEMKACLVLLGGGPADHHAPCRIRTARRRLPRSAHGPARLNRVWTQARGWLGGWGGLLSVGVLLEGVIHTAPHLAKPFGWCGAFISDAAVQMGGVGLAVTVAGIVYSLVRHARSGARPVLRANYLLLSLMVLALVVGLLGELSLRLVFWHGLSSSTSGGPMKRRFAQCWYRKNQFGSRGPEAMGPKPEGRVRLMVQGDSVTFGFGIRHEEEIYTVRLLNALNARAAGRFDMTVLAQNGKEIDWHRDQLRQWGAALSPDVLIYQWFPNDMELDKSLRPTAPRGVWTRFFFHRVGVEHSYGWWMVDWHLKRCLNRFTGFDRRYAAYQHTTFAAGTPAWARFEKVFREWAEAAVAAASRRIVLICPYRTSEAAELYARVGALAAAYGCDVIMPDQFLGTWSGRTSVSRFDAHPNERVHQLMAQAIEQRLEGRYSELFASSPPTSSPHVSAETGSRARSADLQQPRT